MGEIEMLVLDYLENTKIINYNEDSKIVVMNISGSRVGLEQMDTMIRFKGHGYVEYLGKTYSVIHNTWGQLRIDDQNFLTYFTAYTEEGEVDGMD